METYTKQRAIEVINGNKDFDFDTQLNGITISPNYETTYPNTINRNMEWVPAVNLYEASSFYEMEIFVPGFSKEECAIKIEDRVLTVYGEKIVDEEAEEFTCKVISEQFVEDYFQVQIFIGEEIEEDSMKAYIENGVLTILVAKVEANISSPKFIEIQDSEDVEVEIASLEAELQEELTQEEVVETV